ncbi:MAG: SLBB domain-containing protein [Wenyingzhuangia sp.]
MKVRKILILLLTTFGLLGAHSQTTQDVISEANRLDINSKQEAISALTSKGISESQAREMARLRGINFDSFLSDYLKSKPSSTTQSNLTKPKNDVVTELKVNAFDAVFSLSDSISQNTRTNSNDIVTEKLLVNRFDTDSLFEDSTQIDKTKTNNYFGYNIFENNPFGQKEYLIGNIDEGYILAPGDELRITVFGDNNLEFVSKIDLNGNIVFPEIGVFLAAGNSFKTLKERVQLFLGKYYSGLLSSPARTFLDVSLTQIRPVKVTVLGNVNTPGPHLVSGMATVLNALYASGGIKTSGTLREVKVYRNNKLIKSIDLYDYITQGNIDQDIRLSNNDVLFVGPRFGSVTLSGEVNTGAIYELKPSESLKDLFDYSGGLPASASVKNINISRIRPFQNRTQQMVFDRFLTTVNYAQTKNKDRDSFLLEDGDLVRVQAILKEQKNELAVVGNVNAPGRYAVDMYTDLKDLLLTGAKGLAKNTYLEKIDIQRVNSTGQLFFKTYDLSLVLSGEVKVTLKENDVVKVYSMKEVQGEKTVRISGFGTEPKLFTWRQDLSIFDLIFQAVSYEELEFQAKVLASRLDLKRFDQTTGLYKVSQYSIDKLEELKTTYLLPKDQIVLYTKSVLKDITPTISVLGSVGLPGEISLASNMYVEDAILMAQGFLETAEKNYVHINRLDRSVDKGTYSKKQTYKLDKDYMLGLKKKPSSPFILKNHDIITVVSPLRALKLPVVSVEGEIKLPQNIILENDNISIAELIELAGGLTSKSNLNSSYVLRDSLKLYFDIEKNYKKIATTLIDKDILMIGSNLTPVKTNGALNNPTIFNWHKGKRAKYYIRKSGGTKKRIESKIVIHANGKSEKINLFNNPKMYPGSEIIATAKPEKIKSDDNKFMDNLVNVFSVIASALTTVVLASQL